jgi:hypothetical protein
MSARAALTFQPRRPKKWNGRYARIPGDTSVFHIRLAHGGWWPEVEWRIDDDTARCRMVDSGDVRLLVDAIVAGKRAQGVQPGGAFHINEFGQVLVPAYDRDGTSVRLVGECAAPLQFKNPFIDAAGFDLTSHRGLQTGDSWDRPYVGMPHNLSVANKIYFKRSDAEGTVALWPPDQDPDLIAALRAVRPSGPVRFIVTAGGLVATKVELASGWEPRYVGRINPACWFEKTV